jgi:hypothetical protein
MLSMAAVPAVASAQAVTAFNPAGGNRQGPPGSVLRGNLAATSTTQSTVTVTGSPASIEYFYRQGDETTEGACVPTSGTGTTRNLNPALPRVPGTYGISFRAFSTANCAGTPSNTFDGGGTVTVTPIADNPPIALRCNPLKVLLVLDESLSIDAANATDEVREAATGFVDALAGTGAELGIDAFSINARHLVDGQYLAVDEEGGTRDILRSWINPQQAGGNPNGYDPTRPNTAGTNWHAAFANVTGSPNLIVFVTDGNPNTRGFPTPTTPQTTLDGSWGVMTPAAAAADALKDPADPEASESRVFAIGVGDAVGDTASESRLTAVSGRTEFRAGGDFARSDFTTVGFDQLRASLTGIVARLCGGSLTITKYEQALKGAAWQRAPGWEFTTTLRTEGHRWLNPSAAGTGSTASLETRPPDGEASFVWTLPDGGQTRIRVADERSKPGFRLVLIRCRIYTEEGEVRSRLIRTRRFPRLTLEEREYATCAVFNRRKVGHLQVVKRLVPDNDPGRFDLFVDDQRLAQGVGNGGETPRIPLPVGEHTVWEQAAEGTDLAGYSVSTTCVNKRNGDEVSGVGTELDRVSVTLRSRDDWLCTITNTSTTHGNLRVVKHLVSGEGLFNLRVTNDDLVDVVTPATDVGDGGSTERTRLPFGTYFVSETAGTNTDLADFSPITINCINESTGESLPSFPQPGPGPVPVTLGTADVLCTITNEPIPPTPPPEASLTVE